MHEAHYIESGIGIKQDERGAAARVVALEICEVQRHTGGCLIVPLGEAVHIPDNADNIAKGALGGAAKIEAHIAGQLFGRDIALHIEGALFIYIRACVPALPAIVLAGEPAGTGGFIESLFPGGDGHFTQCAQAVLLAYLVDLFVALSVMDEVPAVLPVHFELFLFGKVAVLIAVWVRIAVFEQFTDGHIFRGTGKTLKRDHGAPGVPVRAELQAAYAEPTGGCGGCGEERGDHGGDEQGAPDSFM